MQIGQKDRSLVRIISWLLIAALFVLTVQPMHVHLEHSHAVSGHDHEHQHVIDVHFSADDLASVEHNGTVIPLTPEGMLKQTGDNPLLAAIIVCLAFLLLGVAHTSRQRPGMFRILPGSAWYSIAPPLRGPPRL